ncbi:MAG TPA: hypothetical protein PLP23_18185 [Panacibacter sp.]|nr:hypothetical protein [Panacibacter sp.]
MQYITQFFFLISTFIFAAIPYRQPTNYAVPADLKCKTEIDSITKKLVYTTADIEAINEGGEGKLQQALVRGIIYDDIALDSIMYIPPIVVAFIIDKDGSIKGERVINDLTHRVGKQMLEIIKLFKWTPAKCNGKYVPMIKTQMMIIDIAEQ